MTNAEFYKDKIDKIERGDYLMAVRNNVPCKCTTEKCSYCQFIYSNKTCAIQRKEWLNAEHK